METGQGISRLAVDRYGGGVSYAKQDWRKIPTERFRLMMMDILGKMDKRIMPDSRREWFDNHYLEIKDYPTMNPGAMLFGLACIGWETKQIDPGLFKKAHTFFDLNRSWIRQIGLTMVDVVRYARRWQLWFAQGYFSDGEKKE